MDEKPIRRGPQTSPSRSGVATLFHSSSSPLPQLRGWTGSMWSLAGCCLGSQGDDSYGKTMMVKHVVGSVWSQCFDIWLNQSVDKWETRILIDVDMLVIFRSSWRCWLHVQPSLQNGGSEGSECQRSSFFFPWGRCHMVCGRGSAWTLSRNLRREAPGNVDLWPLMSWPFLLMGKFGKIWLVVTGTWLDYDFPIILGMSSSQLTFTPSFFREIDVPPTSCGCPRWYSSNWQLGIWFLGTFHVLRRRLMFS